MTSSTATTCLVTIGMAGTGKTTLVQRINSYLRTQNNIPYLLNLDPAVKHLPYSANIDIRDTVDYKNVMKEYGLGVTCVLTIAKRRHPYSAKFIHHKIRPSN
jgi:GTPase SAR1 family protein